MIHVICTDISGLKESDYDDLYAKASPERKCRADRCRRREDALRCVAADALLRYALGTERYTLEKERNGKPYIVERTDFHFNLSHSGCWVVLAWGSSEVGVDVEKIRMDTDLLAIAKRFYAPEEQCYILEEPEQSRRRFFEVWTAKESYVKYLGTGLQKNLASFNVLSLEPKVRLYQRELPGGYCLCLCTAETECSFERLDLQQI